MAYLRKKITAWLPPLFAALLFALLLAPADDAIPVQTWTYEGTCREMVAGTTEGRQALVGSLWQAPLPTLIGLPAASLLPRGAETPMVARSTIFMALAFLFWTLSRFCQRLFPTWTAYGCWVAAILLLARQPELAIQPQQTVTLTIATVTLIKLADWFETRSLGDLVKFSFSLALLALCGAALAGWSLLLALLFLAITILEPATRPRFQGLLILGLLPTFYAVAIWALMSWLILSDALYAWRFALHGLISWQGWPDNAFHLKHIAPLACCALIGVLAATRRAPRTALLGFAGVAVFAWYVLLQGLGLGWSAGTAANVLILIALITLISAWHAFGVRHPMLARSATAGAILLLTLFWVRTPISSAPSIGIQNRETQHNILDAVESDVLSRTPYGRIFICGYRGLGLLESEQREHMVTCLDLHIGSLRERYPRQNLFLLVPRPEAEAALECTVWRHKDIYAHGVARTLFAGDWGHWRLYEIVTAPLEEQLHEWRH